MMKKRNQKKELPLFYIIYLSVLAAVILFIIAALGIVTQRLAEYESAQPKHVAAEVFTEYFEPVNYSALLADAVYDAGAATPSEITDHLTAEIGSETITYSLGSSAVEGVVTYIVKAGNMKFAAINLTESEKTTEHGYPLYELASIDLYLTTSVVDTPPETEETVTYTVSIAAPVGYTVQLGGIDLLESHISEYYKSTKVLPHFPTDSDGIDFCTYKISGLETIPESIVVKDNLGADAPYEFDADTLTFTVGVNYSESLKETHAQFVSDAVTGYAAFMQADSSFSKIKKYFDPDSALYDAIEAAGKDLWMVKDHDGYDFTDIEVGEFFAINSTTVACHISFTHILYNEGKADRPDVIDMYVFLHDTGNGYKIYEWYNNT